MRAVLLAIGSRGDTEPCVGLGAALRARGHEVVVVAPERYAAGITAAGLDHRPLTVDPAEVMASQEGQALLGSGPLGFVRGMRTVAAPLAEQVLRDAAAASDGADVVLAPPVGGLGRHLAELRRCAQVVLHFQPSERTAEFPNPLTGSRQLGRPLNRASYTVLEGGTELVLHGIVNRARRTVLGLAPLRRGAGFHDRRERVPTLVAVSPLLQPRPADWPAHVHLTGAWPAPSVGAPTEALPPDLLAFLDDGPPPVFVGFGSMVSPDPFALAETVVDAARRAGARAVVQGLPVEASADVFAAAEIAHAALFDRVAVVVHHGGAGTTAAGLRAGRVSVVAPFFGDQPYWAGRVAALGIGPAVGRARDLTAGGLAAAVRRALGDVGMRRRAARLGAALRTEDGAGLAAALVERMVRTRAGSPAPSRR